MTDPDALFRGEFCQASLERSGHPDGDLHQVAGIVERIAPDWIFNLAGVATGKLRRQLAVNLMGAVNLLEAVRERSPGSRVILVGSAAEYGMVLPDQNPLSENYPCRRAYR